MGWSTRPIGSRRLSFMQWTQRTLPYLPSWMSLAAAWVAGQERCWVPPWTMRSYLRAASIICWPSQMRVADGLLDVDVFAGLAAG